MGGEGPRVDGVRARPQLRIEVHEARALREERGAGQ